MAKNQPAAKKTTRRAIVDAPVAKKTTTAKKTVIKDDPPADSPVIKALGGATAGPASQQEAVKLARRHGEDIVTAVVPKAFKLTDDRYRMFEYDAGVIDMPRSHAEHKYSIANGVSIHKGGK